MSPTNPTRTQSMTIILVVFLVFSSTIITTILKQKSHHHQTNATTTSPHSLLKTTCAKTFYPSLCISTLSPTLSPQNSITRKQIVELSINRTLQSVENSRTKISKLLTHHQELNPQQKGAISDCVEMLDQTLYELRNAVDDLKKIPDTNPMYRRYENLKTLLSAAMTNQNSCLEGLSDVKTDTLRNRKNGSIKKYLRNRLVPIFRMASNSLAMVKEMEALSVNGQKGDITKMPSNGFDRKLTEGPTVRRGFVVAHGGGGDFRSIRKAVEMAPSMSRDRFVIKIKAGVYLENVEIPREKTNIMFVGDGRDKTVISASKNVVDGSTTFNSATLGVAGDGFIARDLTIINTSGPLKGQAVALRVNSNLAAFYRCNISSYQDTLYAHSLRQFYRECTIQGTIDFIFGNAAAVFQKCLILVRRPKPGQKNMVTAQGREDPNQNTGISIQHSTIVATPDLARSGKGNYMTYLGRPWRNHSRTMVMTSYLGDLIHPQGWHEWNRYSTVDTVEYAEYRNMGPGSNTRRRVQWGGFRGNVSQEEALQFTVGEFIQGGDWLESSGVPFVLGV